MGNTVENLKATGELFVRRYDENMALVEERHIPNLVVTAGLNYMASRILSNTAPVMTNMAVGTGSTAAAAGQTILVSEIFRKAFNSSSVTANTVTYQATFVPGTATGALVEAGIHYLKGENMGESQDFSFLNNDNIIQSVEYSICPVCTRYETWKSGLIGSLKTQINFHNNNRP